MLQLKRLFKLNARVVPLTEWGVREAWFAELSGVWRESDELWTRLQEEGRFVVKQLVYDNIDGYRYAAMHTLWFDGVPVAIVQDAGRSGRDHQKRWVTNVVVFGQLLGYLLQAMVREQLAGDYADPEQVRYEDEVLEFYGTDYGAALGFPSEPRREDVCALRNEMLGLSSVSDHAMLVMLKKGAPRLSEVVRWGSSIYRLEREVPREELDAANPRIGLANDEEGIDRVLAYLPGDKPAGAFVQRL